MHTTTFDPAITGLEGSKSHAGQAVKLTSSVDTSLFIHEMHVVKFQSHGNKLPLVFWRIVNLTASKLRRFSNELNTPEDVK